MWICLYAKTQHIVKWHTNNRQEQPCNCTNDKLNCSASFSGVHKFHAIVSHCNKQSNDRYKSKRWKCENNYSCNCIQHRIIRNEQHSVNACHFRKDKINKKIAETHAISYVGRWKDIPIHYEGWYNSDACHYTWTISETVTWHLLSLSYPWQSLISSVRLIWTSQLTEVQVQNQTSWRYVQAMMQILLQQLSLLTQWLYAVSGKHKQSHCTINGNYKR